MLPLTSVEIDGYCASTLFPSLPPSPLSMPKQLRRALNETQGVISKLRDVVELHSDHFARQELSSPPFILKPLLVVFGLTIILVLVGLAYYLMPVASADPLSLNQQEEERVELIQPTHNLISSVPAVELDESQAPPILEPKEMIQVPVTVEPVSPEPAVELALGETIVSSLIKPEAFNETQLIEVDKAEVDKVPKVEPVKDERLVDIGGKEPSTDWFKAELKRSRDWFESSEKSRATIQIMSISLDSETYDSYLSYVETLQKKGVDISQLRVHPKRVREKAVLIIFFGEYDNLRMARKLIIDLPSSLRANQPFPRSVGGIWDEISQL